MIKTVQKRLLSIITSLLFLTACNNSPNQESTDREESLTTQNREQQSLDDVSNNEDRQDSSLENEGSDAMEETRLRLTFNNEEVIVNMDDNPTSKSFISMLPLTLTFEDYAGTEKISYPPNKLSAEEAPSGMDPAVGDLAYFAPWGNLALYYKDFGYSNGLIKLGKIESGLEKLENLNGEFTVLIEKIE
ncbi:cyclophilin-like fold protein [Ureibacillus sp. GCM10028918]|uniref:cyclophilin-like fold protein n=1 Tax=Ureibacillus sp. GCM10028918 TaxID=3273429 RepID=UPI0036224E66